MPFQKNILTAAILAGMAGGLSPLAQAGIKAAVCQVNDEDGCAGGAVAIPASGILTLRGYAYDMETNDRPQPGGYIQIRNQDTFTVYRLPIKRIEARPEILGSELAGTVKPDQYSIVNAGFIAQVFMASLPPGSYAVVEARVSMIKAGLVNIPLDASSRATFRLDESSSPFRLVAPDGSVVPLNLKRENSGSMRADGYPPLRDGQYRLEAQLNAITGPVSSDVDFNYQRPVLDVAVSVPIVQDFPGSVSKIMPINPLTQKSIKEKALPVIIDAVENESFKINGGIVQEGQAREIEGDERTLGAYKTRFQDDSDSVGEQTVRLFVNLPDAPNIRLKVRRWNPANLISVAASKPSASIKVDDINIEGKIQQGLTEECRSLVMEHPLARIPRIPEVFCAFRWKDTPESLKYNPYRANSLTGTIHNLGDNVFSYTTGVIYFDPIEQKSRFYPSKTPDGFVSIHGLNPKLIDFSFQPTRALEPTYTNIGPQFPGKYFAEVVPDQPRLAGVIVSQSAHRNFFTRVTYPDGSERENYGYSLISNTPLAFLADEPWKIYSVKVESWYEKAPEFRTEKTLDFVGIPLKPVIEFDQKILSNNQTNTVVSGYMGVSKGRQIVFDPASMGRWQVQVFELKNDGEESMSIPVDVEADGTFSVDIGQLSEGTRIIKAVAKMIDGSGTVITQRVESRKRSLITERGEAVEGKIAARELSGRAPFRQSIYFQPSIPTLIRNIKTVRWEQEENGVWKEIELNNPKALSYFAQMSEAGKYRYRVVITNMHSNKEFASEPLELQAYNVPNFNVVAPAAAAVNKPLTLSIEPNGNVDAEYTWSFISQGKIENASDPNGMTFTFTPKELTGYVIKVSARERGAPETTESLFNKVVSIRAVNPLAARASLSGPIIVEAGKTYRFEAKHNDVVSTNVQKSYEIKGYWSLPDGSVVHEREIDYAPKPNDKGLSYYTYVDGYPEETSVAFHSLRPWVYQWPTNWNIKLTPVYLDSPALIRYSVDPVNFDLRLLNGEPLTYTWSVPPGVTQSESSPSIGSLEISQHGTYQIAVQIADSRGNVVNVSSNDFSVLPAKAVKTQTTILSKYGESYYAPGSYQISLKTLEVPRGDNFLKHELIVNDERVSEFAGSSYLLSFAQPGDYEVVLRTHTRLGNYGESTHTLKVNAPPNPECSVDTKEMATGFYFTAQCTVAVGFLRSYTWNYELDGKPQRSVSKQFMIPKTWLDADRVRNLELTVESDLGAKYMQSIPISR